MFKILPSDAIISNLNGFTSRFYPTSDWWMTYEYFCRKFLDWCNITGTSPYEVMNPTSSVGNSEFSALYKMDSARDNLVYLFKHAGRDGNRGDFLRYMGIKNWSDLHKPIAIHGWRPKNFPLRDWFLTRGRIFKESPNPCHTEAKWAISFSLQFCGYNKRWQAIIYYDYTHGYSSWSVELEQNCREKLDSFAERINKWIDELMVPESDGYMVAEWRSRKVDTWHKKREGLKTIFSFGDGLFEAEENALTDSIMALRYQEININKARYSTLMKWARKENK